MTDHVTDRSLLSGRVKRYSCWMTIREQTVGDHTWGVYHIFWRIFGLPSAEIALYIHLHDAEEIVVGDNPFPMSSQFPSLRTAKDEMEKVARQRLNLPDLEISAEDKVRVKICDLLEMYQFGMQEREMGNLLATPIIERTRTAAWGLSDRLSEPQEARNVRRFVDQEDLRHSRVIKMEGSTNVR